MVHYRTYFVYGIIIILLSSATVLWPRAAWRVSLFGGRWWYAEPDRLEPSGCAIAYIRILGVGGLIAGVVLIVYGVRAAVAVHRVDTSPGTAGAYALRLDRVIRELATSGGRGTRERTIAQRAIRQVTRDIAVSVCAKVPPLSSPSSSPSARHSSLSLRAACIRYEESVLDAAGDMAAARSFPVTGNITVRADYLNYIGGQTVCLTVARDPSAAGKVRSGACRT